MDVDTTPGAWPGRSCSSEPRQVLGPVPERGGGLRIIMWNVLLSVQSTQDPRTPQGP